MAGAAGHRRAAHASTPWAVGPTAPYGARRELIPGTGMAGSRTRSRAAAHPADLLAVNRVGQVTHGLVGHLRQSCRAQDVNHMLPGELHRNHLRLNADLLLTADVPRCRGPVKLFGVSLTKLTVGRLLSIVKS
jgi:hypothetical protein